MDSKGVRSGGHSADSDNESTLTGESQRETVRAADSAAGVDGSDGVSVRELLNALMEKDRVLTALLERLVPSATPQPLSSGASGGIAAFQVMPDLSNNITSFDGCEDAPTARDWIENLRTTATLHSWPESFMLETAKSRLTGPARDWLRSRRSEIKTWRDFEERFRRTFVSQTRAAERWRKMHERVQQRNESSVVYFHAKVRLCKEANLDFWDTREQIITGLRSKQLSTMLLGKSHEDDDDILHDIQEFERIERERQEFFGSTRDRRAASDETRAQNVSALHARKSAGDDSTKDRRPPLSNEKGERKCYNCGQYGHIARDCPQPKRPMKCLRCNGTDHTQRHCNVVLQRNEANTVTEPVREIKSASVLLKEVTMNGKFTVVGLIDTGSSGCLLRASAAARCDLEIVPDATALYGFGNSNVPAAKSIGKCKADLCIDGVLAKDIPILVVPDEAQSVDLLVGRSFTELPYITYARMGGSLRFWRCSDCPFAHLEPYESHQRLQLRAKEECVLQRGLPKTIITDRGSCFTSRAFEEFCATRGVQHVLNSTRHPQANGQVERVNRTVLPVITTAMKDPEHRDWDENLKYAECSLNNAVSKSTGKTPYEVLHGYKPVFYGLALQEANMDDENAWKDPSGLQETARHRLLEEQAKSKQAYDKRHYPAGMYDVGEVVFLKTASQHTGKPTKTQPKYRGPLVVTEVLPADTYRVADLNKSTGSRYATTAHVSQLKAWSSTNKRSHLDDDEDEEDSEQQPDQDNCDEPLALRRPRRQRVVPARLRDCME